MGRQVKLLWLSRVCNQPRKLHVPVGAGDDRRCCVVAGAGQHKKGGTPFADMRSQEGKLGLTLLQKALLVEEQQQQQQGTSDCSNKPSLDEIRAQLAAAGNTSKRLKPKLPGFSKAGAAAAGAAAVGLGAKAGSSDELLYDDDDEDYDDEDESTPAFQITFDEQGRAVSRPGNSVSRLECRSSCQHGIITAQVVSGAGCKLPRCRHSLFNSRLQQQAWLQGAQGKSAVMPACQAACSDGCLWQPWVCYAVLCYRRWRALQQTRTHLEVQQQQGQMRGTLMILAWKAGVSLVLMSLCRNSQQLSRQDAAKRQQPR